MKNRQPMSDEQRRAMFARLHGSSGASRSGGGGGASSESSGAGASGTSTKIPTVGTSALEEFQALDTGGSTDPDRLDSPAALDALFSSGSGSPDGNPLPYDLVSTLPPELRGPREKTNTEAAIETALLFSGGLGRIPALAKAIASLGPVGELISSWKTPVAAAIASLGIGKYREKHPTMNPKLEKALAIAQQITGYVSALTGIGAAKGMVTRAAPKTLAKGAASLQKLGEAISRYGKSFAGKLPKSLGAALEKLHGGYTKLADITGASWTDLKNVPNIRRFLDDAAEFRQVAAELRAQAAEIETSASQLAMEIKDKAGRILKSSHKGSLADWESAQRMYDEGAAKWYAAGRGQASSKAAAKDMRELADQMEQWAVESVKDAKMAAVKGALVVAGFTTKEITEEARIRDLQRQMEAAYASGDDFMLPAEKPRGPMGTAAAALVGTLGNPIEKQMRYGADLLAAQTANYRAKYEAIGRAEKAGELTSSEAEAARLELATKEKPWNMAGKGAWTFAPASAAYLAWQGQELSEYFNHEVEVGTVAKVLDGDTIELAGGRIVRMLGVDTPESVHPDKPVEYLGPEASHYQKDKLTGKTVRLVQSPGVDVDKYDRSLRYVETLPGPLDSLFNLPGFGKWIPGADQNKNMIEQGFGQPRYLELSGGHERKKEYDAAVARAKRAGAGVWSPEGLEQLDYHYTPRGGATNGVSKLGTLLGSGLMITGQSGALKEMGAAGPAIAQAWNAALAGLGAAEYNAKAAGRTNAIVFRPPKGLLSVYEKRAETLIGKRRHQRTTR